MSQRSEPPAAEPAFPKLREVAMDAPLQWLRRSWGDIRSCPGPSLFYGLAFVAGGYLLVFVLGGAPEYIAAATSGFLIAGPFLCIELLTFFAGLVILGPLIGHATWHAYRDLVE